jgi:hypothetical protein
MDEYDENVRVVNRVFELLPPSLAMGKYIDTTSTSQQQNLHNIVNYHNSKSRDLDVSIHFNASGQTSALQGCEVLYITQQSLAAQISAAMAGVGQWPNRGAKKRTDLFFLNNTHEPAVLIETCFCTSSGDTTHYHEHFEALCKTIAEEICGQAAGPIPPEPEPIPPEQATVAITVTGNVHLTVNGQVIPIAPPADVIPSYQQNIIATEFYGNGSPGAYGIPIPGADSPAMYLAVPWKDQALKNRQVRIVGPNGKAAIGEIWDLGPWFIDDNFVQLQARPLAETLWKAGEPCPRGPNQGIVPNGAGIDLSPALANAVGIDGKGTIKSFQFVEGVA